MRALITGITGQDGSYLAELLLEKGYEVFGLVRRASSIRRSRIDHLTQSADSSRRIQLLYGDMNDGISLNRTAREVQPDEVYNLAGQSHVRVSFEMPEHTANIDALGTLRLLEALREVKPDAKYYQASSSELFGDAGASPRNEQTPFRPRSPYAVSKLFGYWMTVNYREAYGMFAVNGILFNHECIASETPLLVRKHGIVNVSTPDELVPFAKKGRSLQTFETPGLEVWDGKQWTPVLAITATRRRATDRAHEMLSIQARAGAVEVTAHHQMIDGEQQTVEAASIREGDRLALAENFPETSGWTVLTPELAEFLGLLTAEGYVPLRGTIQFTNNDPALRERVTQLWRQLFLGTTRMSFAPSGWQADREVGQLYLTGGRALCEWLRKQLYTPSGYKRVPPLVLNSRAEHQGAYLAGYYAGDGLQAGKGESIKTNSAVLAQGICWLYSCLGRQCSVYVEHRDGRSYYQLNILSAQAGEKGRHLRREPAEVRRVKAAPFASEWVFDLETGSGRFCAGVGRILVHNSPRRGENFVTRKITLGAARIKLGLERKLTLGNLDARRDWGYAKDYMEAAWLMLQQPRADDYVVATGESHSVRELLDEAFGYLDLDWHNYVETDTKYLRLAEVNSVVGDAAKASRVLGWRPRISFRELVRMMVDADLAALRAGNP